MANKDNSPSLEQYSGRRISFVSFGFASSFHDSPVFPILVLDVFTHGWLELLGLVTLTARPELEACKDVVDRCKGWFFVSLVVSKILVSNLLHFRHFC